jgi:hypothetical protein
MKSPNLSSTYGSSLDTVSWAWAPCRQTACLFIVVVTPLGSTPPFQSTNAIFLVNEAQELFCRLLDGLGWVLTVAMPITHLRGDGVLGLPNPGRELGEAPVRPAVHELGQHVGEPSSRVHAVQLAGFEQ